MTDPEVLRQRLTDGFIELAGQGNSVETWRRYHTDPQFHHIVDLLVNTALVAITTDDPLEEAEMVSADDHDRHIKSALGDFMDSFMDGFHGR